jgi:hypothetical protein
MKKLFLLIGFAAGFVAGSKAGSGPYNQLESKVRSFTRQMDLDGAAGESQAAPGMSYPDITEPGGGVMAPTGAYQP